MHPLEVLYERPGLEHGPIPERLARAYGGGIAFDRPAIVANFVSSVDGVVALSTVPNAPSVIGGKSPHDRFVMGLLRASADAVVIGAGTLRAEPEHRWTPAHVYPEAADDLAALRREGGLAPDPELVVLTAGGDLDPDIPALRGALVVTGATGAAEVARRGVPAAAVVEAGERAVEPSRLVDILRARGHRLVLSEAGPLVTAQLLRDGLLDELFLTVSPRVLGRVPDEHRPGLADGVDLLRAELPDAELLSVRRGADHLLLRYRFRRAARGGATPADAG